MSQQRLYRLGGIALILGGVLAATAHVLHLEAPSDPAQLAHYAHLSQPTSDAAHKQFIRCLPN